MADNDSTKNITATDVATFLADNPDSIADMLATYPKLLALCLTVASDHAKDNNQIDSKVVDLSPALNFKARQDARKIKQTHELLLNIAADNMLNWTRVHHATLGLLASNDLPSMCQVITNEFPVIFDLNQCQLIIEEEVAIENAANAGLGLHPATQIDAATNSQSLYLGLPNDAAQELLVRPTQSLAIIRLPDRLPDPVSQAVLLLGGKTTNSFHPDLGSDLLVLLAEMVGVTLAARLELKDRVQ
ncbi:MAG: DUF484 family protein [Candidatus Puniceispirillaceae bacterium]